MVRRLKTAVCSGRKNDQRQNPQPQNYGHYESDRDLAVPRIILPDLSARFCRNFASLRVGGDRLLSADGHTRNPSHR